MKYEIVILTDYKEDPNVLEFETLRAAITCYEFMVESCENLESITLETKKESKNDI